MRSSAGPLLLGALKSTLPLAMNVLDLRVADLFEQRAQAIHLDHMSADVDGAEKRDVSRHQLLITAIFPTTAGSPEGGRRRERREGSWRWKAYAK